jgi:hypothetical protein
MRERQNHIEDCTASLVILCPKPAAMGLHDGTGNGQPDPHALVFSGYKQSRRRPIDRNDRSQSDINLREKLFFLKKTLQHRAGSDSLSWKSPEYMLARAAAGDSSVLGKWPKNRLFFKRGSVRVVDHPPNRDEDTTTQAVLAISKGYPK